MASYVVSLSAKTNCESLFDVRYAVYFEVVLPNEGGVRVGHRIIEINGQSVVATPHERIVSMLSHSIGEVSRLRQRSVSLHRLPFDSSFA